MKLMKLGTRPDIFFTSGNVRCVHTEVATDLQIQVEDVLFRLHKFPLLSKCLALQALCAESSSSSSCIALDLPDFPGGANAFDACARFCYGVAITVGAHNLVPLRCAAARLGMKEAAERGNLGAKLDAFLASCLLRRWKDALAVLRATAHHAAACEEIGVTPRCVDAVAALIAAVDYPTGRTSSAAAQASSSSSSQWWARDITNLDVDLFWRVMVAVKGTCAVPGSAVGDALKTYARRWLPSVPVNGSNYLAEQEQTDGNADLIIKNHRLLVEKIASLLPTERNAVSCSFLLKLLKAANILGGSPVTKTELTRRVAMQLEDATVSDLLIPSSSPSASETAYDVDAVVAILEEFALRQAASAAAGEQDASPARSRGHRRSRSAESAELEWARRSTASAAASHGAVVRIGRLVDGFLVEAAKDVNLPLDKMVAMAEAVPDCARPVHDELYRAVDTYLRAHPGMDKSARKKLCRVLNCRKLSETASMHAAQNELLPLRVVVQVLFFENARAAAAAASSGPGTNRFADLAGGVKALLTRPRREVNNELEINKDEQSVRRGLAGAPVGDDWSVEGLKRTASRITTLRMKLEEDDDDDADDDPFVHRARAGLVRSASSRVRAFCAIPAGNPRRMLTRLWSSSRAIAGRN